MGKGRVQLYLCQRDMILQTYFKGKKKRLERSNTFSEAVESILAY